VVNGVLFNSAGTTLILFPQGISTYVIPNGTTAIGDKAFYSCSGLTDVTIPASVTAIGSEAFAHCSSLSIVNVAWETSPPAITGETFRNKPDGATLYVPEGKQSTYDTETGWKDFAIAEMTTEGGQGWTLTGSTLTITQTIADATSGNAPWYAHRNRIVTVVIENAVTAIGSYAFEDCSNLSAITLPDGVTTIGSHAFRNCSSLSAITLPEGVTTIGDEAFVRCGLTAITLPATATTIGNDAFQSCSNLASIRVDAGNTAFSSDGGVLFNAGKTTLILYPQGKSGSAYAIPDGVETIGSRAFINCAALTSVTIPATLTSIGSYAFSACPALATVAIPAGVETVGEAAFAYSSALTSIAIPGSVTSIGNRAFEDCTGLTSITAGWTTPPRCTRRPVCQCHPVRHHPLRPRRHESRLRGRKRMERLLHRRTLPFGHARNTPFRHSRRNANA
jgi:hypothetical protein